MAAKGLLRGVNDFVTTVNIMCGKRGRGLKNVKLSLTSVIDGQTLR